MAGLNPLRSVLAVLAGAVLLGFIDQTLERTLVSALADAPPTNEAAYLAIRNQPLVLAATLVTHALAATLAGYILAKIAGSRERHHAVAAAVVLTVAYAFAFVNPNVMLPPVWVRIVMLVVTPPANSAGASIRADARAIQEEAAAARPEEERRQGVPADKERS
jgi:hypothetical protein